MSDENDLELRIGADASGVAPAAAETNTQVKSIADNVGALAAGMKAMGASAKEAFTESTLAAKENLEAVREVAEGITEMRELVSGVGEAMMAAFAVEEITEFVEKMGEASEKTLHTAQTFGLTITEVQKMNAQAALFGVPADAMSTAMMRADKSFATAKEGSKSAAAAFKEAGVDINGSYTQTELLSTALDGLSKMDAGPAKVAAAMAIFGKNIQAIGPLINLTKEQIEEANTTIDAYGAVNETAAMKGVALAESLNVSKVAGQGIANVFTDSMAPAFTSIVDGCNELAQGFITSYNAGGAAKTVMDALTWTVKFLADTIGLAGVLIDYTFKTIDGAAWMLAGIMNAVCDGIVGYVKYLIDAFKTFGDVARDALTLNWSAIGDDIKTGITRASADVVNAARQMGADAAAGFKKGGDEWTSSDKDVSAYEAWSKKMWAGGDKPKAGPKEGTGTTAADPKGKAKGGGDGSDSELQQWEQQLQDKKLAENNFWADDLAGDITFWQQKLAILQAETGGTKAEITKRNEEIRTIRQKIFDDSKQLATQQRAQELANEEASTRDAVNAANAKYKAVKDGLDAQISAVKAAAKDGSISPQAELSQLQLLNDQEVAAVQAKIAAITKAEMDGLKAREAIYATDPVNLKKTQDAEVSLANTAQGELTDAVAAGAKARQKIDQDAAAQAQAQWKQAIGGIVTSFGSGIESMVNGTMTLQQAGMKVAQAMENAVFKAVEGMVTKWLSGELAKTAGSAAGATQRGAIEVAAHAQSMALSLLTAEKDIFNSALKAAAGAYNAMAGIPIIGPVLGAAAAAVTFTAVEAYGQLASAAGGYDIPSDVNPIVQTHAEEMILPANIANPFRQMAANYNAPGGGPANDGGASGGGGDTHNWHISAMDPRSFESYLRRNSDVLANTINAKVRGGAKIAGA